MMIVGVQMRVVHVDHMSMDKNLAEADQFAGEIIAMLQFVRET